MRLECHTSGKTCRLVDFTHGGHKLVQQVHVYSKYLNLIEFTHGGLKLVEKVYSNYFHLLSGFKSPKDCIYVHQEHIVKHVQYMCKYVNSWTDCFIYPRRGPKLI